ncbi:MAG: type II secretion system F family protein [Verrucomicrobiota bacterium]
MNPEFFRKLGTMIDAGMPLTQSLQHLQSKSHGDVASLAEQLSPHVASGNSLADSLRKVPGFIREEQIYMIEAAELSGRLNEALMTLAEMEEEVRSVHKDLTMGFIYPGILFHLGCLIPAILTFVTKGLFFALLEALIFLVPAYAIAFLTYVFWQIGKTNKRVRTVFDEVMLNLPMLKEWVRLMSVYHFCIAFRQMLIGGFPLQESWERAARSANNICLSSEMHRVAYMLGEGQEIAQTLRNCSVFSTDEVEMLETAEKAGKMDSLLQHVANDALQQARRKARQLVKALSATVYVIVALFVMFRIFLILQSIFDQVGSVLDLAV